MKIINNFNKIYEILPFSHHNCSTSYILKLVDLVENLSNLKQKILIKMKNQNCKVVRTKISYIFSNSQYYIKQLQLQQKMQDYKQPSIVQENTTNINQRQEKRLKKENQLNNLVKSKSKSLLKRKNNKIPLLLNLSYVFKISESLIINERALKQPQTCTESFMANVFYFKSIQSINLNQNFISLSLKEIQQNQFPLSYYTERFRSFGDQQFYDLARNLEMLQLQLAGIGTASQSVNEQSKNRINLQKQLEQFILQKKDKQFICFYSEPIGDHITMNRIVISSKLLLSLGYDIKEICSDFLKYRHIFFQIFDTSLYCQIVKRSGQRLKALRQSKCSTAIQEDRYKNKNPCNQDQFEDYIFRTKRNSKGVFQQKVKAHIKFSKPMPNISLYQVENIDETDILHFYSKKNLKQNQNIVKWQQNIINTQIQSLKILNHDQLENLENVKDKYKK